MNLSYLTAAGSYWVLTIMWSGILIFYILRLRSPRVVSPLVATLIWILAIDAFRTLFESLYFGAWYTSLAGFLPPVVHDTLVQPLLILVPKLLNVVAAGLVLGILIRRWLPEEEAESQRHHDEIEKLERHTSELCAVHTQLRAEQTSLRRLFETQEGERQIVSHEIHDGIAQYATGARMMTEALLADPKSEPIRERLQTVSDVLEKTVEEGRRLIRGLRPLILDEGGIVEAIDHLIREQDASKMTINFTHDVACDEFPSAVTNALYRIAQESLTNATKHSDSERLDIKLRTDGNNIQLDVQDWGVGCELGAAGEGHYGLEGIRERAKVLGGNARIISSPRQGMHITIELPISDS